MLFHVPVVVILMLETGKPFVERRGEIAPLSDVEMDAAQSALANDRPTTAAAYPFDASRFDFWPIKTPAGETAVIGLAFDPDERPAKPEILVETIGNLFALAIDSRHAAHQT
jgi:two-component system sensor histidine kinase KdpD